MWPAAWSTRHGSRKLRLLLPSAVRIPPVLVLPVLLLLACCSLLGWPLAVRGQTPRLDLLKTLLPSTYDDSLRPLLGTGQPVVVYLNYRIDLLYAVSSADETFALDFFMTERWVDPRLQFNSSTFSLPYGDSLRLPTTGPWKPDTYFFNSIRCVVSDSLLKLDPSGSGQVTWTRHQTCTFYTPFDLQQFPFDSQAFPIKRLSFFYNSSELSLVYSPLGCFQPDPRLDYVNALWDLTDFSCGLLQYNGQVDETAAWLYVERRWQAYVLKMIVPMFLIVIVSSLSYFIDPAAAPARVGLSVAIVLTVSTFNLLVSQDLPKINYSTLLDWYVWKCFLFVIAAVAEFAFVNHLLVSKTYPPLVARLVDDFFQWTVPVVWGLSNLIFWPILPSPYLDAFFGLVMAAYIAANAYRIYWCFRHGKEGMIAPVQALLAAIKRRLDEGERLAKEQLEKQQRNLQQLGLIGKSSREAGGQRRGRRRGRGRGRGRTSRGREGVKGERLTEGQDGEGEAGDDPVHGLGISVVVTPPTPHWSRRAGEDEKKGDGDDAQVELQRWTADDTREQALSLRREHPQGEGEEEEELSMDWKEGGFDDYPEDEGDEEEEGEEEDEEEEQKGERGRRVKRSGPYAAAVQDGGEDDDVKEENKDEGLHSTHTQHDRHTPSPAAGAQRAVALAAHDLTAEEKKGEGAQLLTAHPSDADDIP